MVTSTLKCRHGVDDPNGLGGEDRGADRDPEDDQRPAVAAGRITAGVLRERDHQLRGDPERGDDGEQLTAMHPLMVHTARWTKQHCASSFRSRAISSISITPP